MIYSKQLLTCILNYIDIFSKGRRIFDTWIQLQNCLEVFNKINGDTVKDYFTTL